MNYHRPAATADTKSARKRSRSARWRVCAYTALTTLAVVIGTATSPRAGLPTMGGDQPQAGGTPVTPQNRPLSPNSTAPSQPGIPTANTGHNISLNEAAPPAAARPDHHLNHPVHRLGHVSRLPRRPATPPATEYETYQLNQQELARVKESASPQGIAGFFHNLFH